MCGPAAFSLVRPVQYSDDRAMDKATDIRVIGTHRVFRGRCWCNDRRFCRSAYRLPGAPSLRGNDLGFRVVLAPN